MREGPQACGPIEGEGRRSRAEEPQETPTGTGAKRVKGYCAPCRATLKDLEQLAILTSGEELDEYMRQHDGLRRRCRGKRPEQIAR